jgi:hypothetical protein
MSRMRQNLPGLLFGLCGALVLQSSWAGELTLQVDDVRSPDFAVRGIHARLAGPDFSVLKVDVAQLSLGGKSWRNLRLECPGFHLLPGRIECPAGTVQGAERFPVSFSYDMVHKSVALSLHPGRGEKWDMRADFARPSWVVSLDVANGRLERLSPWLPANMPRISSGRASGTIKVSGARGGLAGAAGTVRLSGVAFSDDNGLHAGDKIAGQMSLNAARRGNAWQGSANLKWQSGEVFWQPLYIAEGGHTLALRGNVDAKTLQIDSGTLNIAKVGTARFSGQWDRVKGALREATLSGQGLDMAPLYTLVLKPFLEKTVLADMETEGKVDVAWSLRDGETTEFDLGLHNFHGEDKRKRFALYGVNGWVPWARNGERTADIRIDGAQLLQVPIGPMEIPLRMKGLDFSLNQLKVPLLDGTLNIADFRMVRNKDDWDWSFSGGLTPVSMDQLTRALGVPPMSGTISGIIPEVTYANHELKMDGALLIRAFDGTIVVKDLAMTDPLGRAPRLVADLDMRNLDLDLVTRAFSFGNMEGRIDVAVKDIELSNWRPVRFDAKVASSPGDYRKRISQKAVENISALGGAGAAAAIQRSFLRFFETFGYSRIGLSCQLRNGVCVMDGVEESPQGFVIIKGGGIPAITVIGYNRYVSWDELLQRLKRITQGNAKPIVQ